MSTDPNPKQTSRRIKWIPIKKIRLLDDKPVDDENVHQIAESLSVHGLIYPLLVRHQVEKRSGKEVRRTVLVSGRDRLEAAEFARMTDVPVMYIEGDDVNAELVRIGDNLWRKRYSVLRRAEMLVEWFSLAAVPISGQVDLKSRGRPPGGLAAAVRELPVIGRSPDSRRKKIQRAKKIASLAPEVKDAVIKARLDNNQHLLLQIAKSGNLQSQLRKVAELEKVVKSLRKKSEASAAKLAEKTDDPEGSTLAGEESSEDSTKLTSDNERDEERQSETTFLELEKFWRPDGYRLWQYASFDTRQRFIAELNRAKNKSPSDIVNFVQEVFAGRKYVIKGQLFEYGKTKGFSREAIKKVCRELGYPSGQRQGGTKVFRNVDKRSRYMRNVTDNELKAAYVQKREQEEAMRGRRRWTSPNDEENTDAQPAKVMLDLGNL
jgi:hypothetical protein